MARYIDLDKAIERSKASPAFPNMGTDGYFLLGVVEDLLKNQPTADVVPKSEVVKVLNEVELLIIITKEMYKQQMKDAPNAISAQSKRIKWIAFENFYEQFAELKKKYTEGENEKT